MLERGVALLATNITVCICQSFLAFLPVVLIGLVEATLERFLLWRLRVFYLWLVIFDVRRRWRRCLPRVLFGHDSDRNGCLLGLATDDLSIALFIALSGADFANQSIGLLEFFKRILNRTEMAGFRHSVSHLVTVLVVHQHAKQSIQILRVLFHDRFIVSGGRFETRDEARSFLIRLLLRLVQRHISSISGTAWQSCAHESATNIVKSGNRIRLHNEFRSMSHDSIRTPPQLRQRRCIIKAVVIAEFFHPIHPHSKVLRPLVRVPLVWFQLELGGLLLLRLLRLLR